MAKTGNGTTRLIPSRVSEKSLKNDLERYQAEALKLGASDTRVIPADMVELDERVRLKCLVGRCYNYGQSANCPPHTPEPEFMRKALRRYQWAVLFRAEVPPEIFANFKEYDGEGEKYNRKLLAISNQIESLAFRDGYYLAMGFGCGSCKGSLCDGMYCQVLDSGRCRFMLRARPSMEAVGIDVFGLAAKVGWKSYPIYRSVNPELVPCASTTGIVFVH